MKKKSASQSAFFNLRVLIAAVFCLVGVFIALIGAGAFSRVFAQAKGTGNNQSARNQDAPGTQTPDVVQMVGPVRLDQDLRNLPWVPGKKEVEERRLTRYPHLGTEQTSAPSGYGTAGMAYVQALLKNIWRPAPTMPGPLLTWEGIGDTCGCQPSDSQGDVGPNHYIEAINESFKIFDKNGNTLAGPTSYNVFFSGLTGTPCGQGDNDGDPFTLYDPIADRWVISDFAFPSFPGSSFWQCIAVSQTNDPVSGGWFLYAIQIDPANPTQLGDYPKFALWNSGGSPAQNAYFFTVNLFTNFTTFIGVRAFALDRASMLSGGPANAIAFTILPAGLGDSYSLVGATARTGSPPPTGENEFLLAVDSPASGGVTLTQVKGWLYHIDFGTPSNSTLGMGANHSPNALITVNGFVDAFTTTTDLVPQQGTTVKLDTLGDKIMTEVAYQNLSGTESLWADQTIILNYPSGPTAIRWYQFDVTGGAFPATPVQQQDWSNTNDGLWRWMPSIAVDQNGNTVIGYSTSNTTIVPSIRYAGRLESDPPGNLAQGEAVMFAGVSAQTSGSRWGDYTRTDVDPSDGMTFFHINQYAQNGDWHTRIGKFNFVGGPSPTPSPTPACSWSAGPNLPTPPTVLIRAVGVFFPDGNFYTMGGRTSDSAGSDFQHVLKYSPTSNTWTQMPSTLADNQGNNMACGVLTVSGTPLIYCVGGSAGGQTTATARVYSYNPATDTQTVLTSGDNWPGDAAGTILPGGFSVFNNKLYILGGFNINVASTNQIWQFDPTAGVGSKWTQMTNTPEGVMYAPTCTIGNTIYLAGASDFQGGTVVDTTNSFSFDPIANTIGTIPPIPRATGETRGLNFCNKMYVMGGGRDAPNPSNEVDIFDPGTMTWSTGIPFVNARRNFPTDTDGTNHIWLAGGYEPATPAGDMEIFNCPVSPCSSPSPTPTATATATATATPTPIITPRPVPTPRPRPTPPPRP